MQMKQTIANFICNSERDRKMILDDNKIQSLRWGWSKLKVFDNAKKNSALLIIKNSFV